MQLRPLLQGTVPGNCERPGKLRPQHHGPRVLSEHISECPVQTADAPAGDNLRASRKRGVRIQYAELDEEVLQGPLRDDTIEGGQRQGCRSG